ncbi:MAG: FtsX-like permease family protein [Granulosicoccus sp.]|nr:FtsX-like permease family protein [Granulosicoccus sp.]
MTSLSRKLVRELWHLKGQVFSIALVVAVGIMSVMTMRGSYDSLVRTQQIYYQDTGFADIWAPLRRAPESLRERLANIPGVSGVDTRVSFLTTLDLPDLEMPAQGLFVSLPSRARPRINDIVLKAGRYLDPDESSEVLISEKFATARALRPGDALTAVINGQLTELDIVGIAISPEHAYSVPPGSLYPDDKRYGVIWMGRDSLGPVYDMDGAFNEAMFTLEPQASEAAVLAAIDRLLDPYGGLGAYVRSDQMSHQIMQAELDQNRIMGTAFPIVFLGVAAFLLNLVLGRLIATQRGEIGVLKAFGYHDREVGTHYLLFAMAAVVLGAIPGAAFGIWLGQGYVRLYGQYFNFPHLQYQPSLTLLIGALSISVMAAALGALAAVRRAARLPPAEAMRAEPPALFRAGWLERSGLAEFAPSSVRMILRNVQRKPMQSVFSSVGVALSTAILVMGLSMLDSIRFMMDLQFNVIQREDLMLVFDEFLDAEVLRDLENIDGVTRVEPYRSVPARLRNEHLREKVSLQGLAPDARLRRLVAGSGQVQPVPDAGLVLSATLAKKLRVAPGDYLSVEVLEGRRVQRSVLVSGVVTDFMGTSGSMSLNRLHALVQGPEMVSGAFLAVEDQALNRVNRYLKGLPAIASVTSPKSMYDSFQKQMDDSLYIGIAFLIAFASVIAIGVIYNGARISLSERGREMASLRVMGFRRREAVILLLGEQAVITVIAIPVGWFIGYWLAFGVASSIGSDAYRLPFVVGPASFIWSAVATCGAAVFSGFLIRHRLNRLDLVEVLKTRE